MTGKLLNVFLWLCGSLLISICSSCNEFDSFGSDLLNGDWINAKGIDTFKLFANSATKDSSITFYNYTYLSSSLLNGVSFPIGKMDDPIFGKVSAGIGTQLRIIPTSNLSFLKSPVDSIILSLRFDTSLFYGKYTNQDPMNFSIYPLTETYNAANIYYSSHVLQYDATKKLGERIGFIPDKSDSLKILDNTTEIRLYPQLRIPLDTTAFMSILRSYNDTVYYTLDSFSKVFNGIAIICEKGSGVVSVQPEHSDSKITIYYHDTSTIESKIEMNMGNLAVKTPYYQVDNQNKIAGQCIDGTIPGDSLLCLQGFEGRDIKLTIPYDSSWKGKFINFAVLQFYVAELPGYDLSNYSLPGLLELFDISSGSKVAIDDVAMGLTSNYIRVFGGNPVQTDVNGKTMYRYKMNITRHFQKSLKAKKPMELIISPLLKLESPARLVFFGPGNSQFPAKLILTYSE